MPISAMSFQPLTPEQASPYLSALKTGLSTYSGLVQNAYLPQQIQADLLNKQADAALKASQASFYPYMSQAQLLGNPLVLASLAKGNPDALNTMISNFANMPTSPADYLKAFQQASTQSSPSIFDRLKSIFGGNQVAPTAISGNSTQNQINQYLSQNPAAAAQLQKTGEYVIPGSATDVSQQSSAAVSPLGKGFSQVALDAYNKAFPNSPSSLDVGSQNDLWKSKLDELGKTADATNKGVVTLDALKNIHDQLGSLEKGPVFGHGPALTSNAQLFDQLAQNQAATNIRALQNGHITDTDFVIANKLKPNRTLGNQAFDVSEDYNKALQLRGPQELNFYKDAKAAGYRKEQADSMWYNFISQNPLFDPKTEKLIPQNAKISSFDFDQLKSQAPNVAPASNSGAEGISSNYSSPAANNPNWVSPMTKLLSKNIQLPQFNSKEEYQGWFNRQPANVQQAIRLKLQGG